MALDKVSEPHSVHRLFHLLIEFVDPELVKIAQHYILRSVGHAMEPVLERLLIVVVKVLLPALHFEDEPRLPQQVNKLNVPSFPLLTIF